MRLNLMTKQSIKVFIVRRFPNKSTAISFCALMLSSKQLKKNLLCWDLNSAKSAFVQSLATLQIASLKVRRAWMSKSLLISYSRVVQADNQLACEIITLNTHCLCENLIKCLQMRRVTSETRQIKLPDNLMPFVVRSRKRRPQDIVAKTLFKFNTKSLRTRV